MDIDKIEPGVDFTEAITKSLDSCDVMLAIIGPKWQGINADNTSRINNANDWVRLEISTALKRNIRVVPVLVDGAELPATEQLPEDLQSLLKRQAYEISNKRWKYDTEELIRFLVKSVGIVPKTVSSNEPVKQESSWWGKNYPWVILGGVLVIGLSVVTNQSDENVQGSNYPVRENKQTIIEDNRQHDVTRAETTTAKEYYIEGNWYDANGLYYLTISQNSNSLAVASYSMAGQQTGQGNGSTNGKNVLINLNVTGYGVFTITSTLSTDEKRLIGSLKIENNGAAYTEPLQLNKLQN